MTNPNASVIRLNPPHCKVFYSQARFRILVAGRRFGKTYLAIAELIRAATSKPNQKCWYIAPTYKQAKMIVWDTLKSFIPASARTAINETELSMTLLNGSQVALKGADNPDSLRGATLHFAIFDEFQDTLAEVWSTIIRPMLATTQGGALFIGTPKGFNHFYDYYMAALTTPGWDRWLFKTIDGGYVTQEELEQIKADPTVTLREYKQEYEASFENMSGKVYHAFNRNLDTDLTDPGNLSHLCDRGGDLYLGLDFNVNPMSAVLGQPWGGKLEVFKEIVLKNSNTTEMCQVVKNLYPSRRIIFYPDPAGNSRSTKAVAGQTDFTIIKEFGFQLYAPKQPYLIVDRVNTVNGLLCNAAGVRRLFVDPSCKNLIKCLDGLTVIPGTNLPDKSLGIEHIGDALGYKVCAMFPIIRRNKVRSKEFRI